MAYRVVHCETQDCYWLLALSETDAIRSVSLTFIIDAGELEAAPSTDNNRVPEGVILLGSGQTFSIVADRGIILGRSAQRNSGARPPRG